MVFCIHIYVKALACTESCKMHARSGKGLLGPNKIAFGVLFK